MICPAKERIRWAGAANAELGFADPREAARTIRTLELGGKAALPSFLPSFLGHIHALTIRHGKSIDDSKAVQRRAQTRGLWRRSDYTNNAGPPLTCMHIS